MKREPVAVIGGGAWGTMLAHLLSINNSNVKQWVRDAAVREEMLLRRTHSRSLPGLSLSPASSLWPTWMPWPAAPMCWSWPFQAALSERSCAVSETPCKATRW